MKGWLPNLNLYLYESQLLTSLFQDVWLGTNAAPPFVERCPGEKVY
jgi:hypothetical protein